MSSYEPVKKAMAAGTPSELICATCPWDRLCVKPPAMTEADIEQHIRQAEARDLEADPLKEKMPMGMLMTTLVFAGKDSMGEMCPVFSLRLRSAEGRQIADIIRSTMQSLGEVTP